MQTERALSDDGRKSKFSQESVAILDNMKSKWRVAFSHKWRKNEHINGLEAASAVMALEWIIKSRIRNSRVIMLTDSQVVQGALRKGRSSSIPILLRCRKFAALSIAHNIKICVAYIPSRLNPAGGPSRD